VILQENYVPANAKRIRQNDYFAKLFIFLGEMLLALGGILFLVGRTSAPDWSLARGHCVSRKNTIVYFPLTTSILLSVVMSFVVYVIGKLRHERTLEIMRIWSRVSR
jgi:hypothetical protein